MLAFSRANFYLRIIGPIDYATSDSQNEQIKIKIVSKVAALICFNWYGGKF